MHDPSLSQSLPLFGYFCRTFSPSRRQPPNTLVVDLPARRIEQCGDPAVPVSAVLRRRVVSWVRRFNRPVPSVSAAEWLSADQGLCGLVAQPPLTSGGLGRHTAGDAKGLEVSLAHFLQDQLVQSQFYNNPLETGVFLLEPLLSARLVDAEATVLVAPTIVGLLGDAGVLDGVADRLAFRQGHLDLTEFGDDLLRTGSLPCHLCPLQGPEFLTSRLVYFSEAGQFDEGNRTRLVLSSSKDSVDLSPF